MERINIKDRAGDVGFDVAYWALISAVAAAFPVGSGPFPPEFTEAKGNYDIELRINGLEFSFTAVVQAMARGIEEAIQRRARELVSDEVKVWRMRCQDEVDSLMDRIEAAGHALGLPPRVHEE